MKITACPKCGGNVRSESIGWKCEKCRGFIDMQGNFNEHIDRPFMTPMTNGDRLRAMPDEELAAVLFGFINLDDNISYCKDKPECGDLLDTEDGIPMEMCIGCLCEWLRRPAEEGTP